MFMSVYARLLICMQWDKILGQVIGSAYILDVTDSDHQCNFVV